MKLPTVEKSKNSQKSLFPRSIRSIGDSNKYTKKLIITAISNITYLRGIFPEDYYQTKMFEGVAVRIVKQATDEYANTRMFSEWLLGAFDALDKKYLKTLSLILYETSKDTVNILENYDFNICYTDKDSNLTLDTGDAKAAGDGAKMNAVRLLRTVMCTVQSLNDLPVTIYMSMRLFYYEDVTPEEYEPPGFVPSEFEKYHYSNGRVFINGGQAESIWHKINLDIAVDESMLKMPGDFQTIDETFETVLSDLENNDDDSGMKTMLEAPKKFKHILDRSVHVLNDQTCVSSNEEEELTSKIDNLSVTSTTLPVNVSVNDLSELRITPRTECACQLEDAKDLKMLRCGKCLTWQHAICYNFRMNTLEDFNLLKQNVKQICSKCALLTNTRPTDSTYIGLAPDMIYELCIWRRILIWLEGATQKKFIKIDLIKLFGIQANSVEDIFKKLESHKILILYKNNKAYRLDKLILQNIIETSFTTSYLPEEHLDEENTTRSHALNKSVCFDLPEEIETDTECSNINLKTAKRTVDRVSEDNTDEESLMSESPKIKGKVSKRRRRSSVTENEIRC